MQAKARGKLVPSEASRSRLGVCISEQPAEPRAHAPWSSVIRKIALDGRRGTAAAGRSERRVRRVMGRPKHSGPARVAYAMGGLPDSARLNWPRLTNPRKEASNEVFF